MFKFLKQIGCLAVIIFVGVVAYNFYTAVESAEPSKQTNTQAATPSDAKPLPEVVALMFRKACREYMNDPDSYKPGTTRIGDHPEGYAYIHEFRGKNAFGALIKDMCGLLYRTNATDSAWTFYNQDQLPDLLKDVTINGKRLTDASGSAPAPREDPAPAAETPRPDPSEAPKPTLVRETCSACSGKGTVPTTASCPKCAGTGKIYVSGKWKPCPKTITTVDRKCADCNGSGTVEIIR